MQDWNVEKNTGYAVMCEHPGSFSLKCIPVDLYTHPLSQRDVSLLVLQPEKEIVWQW